jgi:hypothetical protein
MRSVQNNDYFPTQNKLAGFYNRHCVYYAVRIGYLNVILAHFRLEGFNADPKQSNSGKDATLFASFAITQYENSQNTCVHTVFKMRFIPKNYGPGGGGGGGF